MSTAGKPPDKPGSEGSKSELTPEERAAFQRRSDEIGKRVDAAKGSSASLPKRSASRGEVDGTAMGKALRVSTELIGGILVGSGLGYLLDVVFGTTPLLFILFFLLGSAAGMLNVIRSSAPKMGAKSGTNVGQPPPQAVKDDDEDA